MQYWAAIAGQAVSAASGQTQPKHKQTKNPKTKKKTQALLGLANPSVFYRIAVSNANDKPEPLNQADNIFS